MSLQDSIVTVLTANGTLAGAFPGGILTYESLGTLGLTRKGYPTAFDATTGLLKKTIIVRARTLVTTQQVTDEDLQFSSFTQPFEIALYADRGAGYTALLSAQQTIYGLLHDRQVGTARLRERERHTVERDRELDFACLVWSVYDAYGVLTP